MKNSASLNALFEKARSITAAEVARTAGIELRQRGSRLWASCPLHRERTPSLAFFDDGGWHCFGCHSSGADGTSFYAALHSISQADAARQLIDTFGLEGPAKPSAHALIREIKQWRDGEIKRLRKLHAEAKAQAIRSMDGVSRDAPFPDDFGRAIQLQTKFDSLIAWLEEAPLTELFHMWKVGK